MKDVKMRNQNSTVEEDREIWYQRQWFDSINNYTYFSFFFFFSSPDRHTGIQHHRLLVFLFFFCSVSQWECSQPLKWMNDPLAVCSLWILALVQRSTYTHLLSFLHRFALFDTLPPPSLPPITSECERGCCPVLLPLLFPLPSLFLSLPYLLCSPIHFHLCLFVLSLCLRICLCLFVFVLACACAPFDPYRWIGRG